MIARRFLPLLPALSLLTPGAAMTATPRYYDVAYRAHFHPETGVVDMEIALSGDKSRTRPSVDDRPAKQCPPPRGTTCSPELRAYARAWTTSSTEAQRAIA